MRIVQITTDSREHFKDYDRTEPYFGTAPEALLDGFRSIPDVEVHVVCCLRRPVVSPHKIADNIFYHSLVVPKIGWMKTLYQGCIRSVRNLLREIGPDVVHGQGTERDCALSAVMSSYPNVITIHGNMAEIERLGLLGHPWFGKAAARLETFALKRTLGVFCNSEYTRDLVSPRAKRTWLVPNPIRNQFFSEPVENRHGNETPVLINVGLITPRKRQVEILVAVRELFEAGYKLKIIFAGHASAETPYGKAFFEELSHGTRAGYAQWLGYVEADQLIQLMDSSDGFIHFPSEEAFGLVVAEALARNLKFFGADLGGIRDITTGVPAAELHGSIKSMKDAMTRWLQQGALKPADQGAIIKSRYSPDKIARRHVEIYKELLNK